MVGAVAGALPGARAAVPPEPVGAMGPDLAVLGQRPDSVAVAVDDQDGHVVVPPQAEREHDVVATAVAVRGEVPREGQALDDRWRALEPGCDEESADRRDDQ